MYILVIGLESGEPHAFDKIDTTILEVVKKIL